MCDGKCSDQSYCRGQVKRYNVQDKRTGTNWGDFNYCEYARDTDIKSGFTLTAIIPHKQMSDTMIRLNNWKEFAAHIERAIERSPSLEIRGRIIKIRQDFSAYVRGQMKILDIELTDDEKILNHYGRITALINRGVDARDAVTISDIYRLTEWRHKNRNEG